MQANKRVFNEQQKQQARVNASFGKLTMGSAHCMERLQVPHLHMQKEAWDHFSRHSAVVAYSRKRNVQHRDRAHRLSEIPHTLTSEVNTHSACTMYRFTPAAATLLA